MWFIQFKIKDGDGEKGESASEDVESEGDTPSHGNWYVKKWATQDIKTRSLFPWTHETMTDFVVGPRMFWDRNERTTPKTTF